MAKKKGQEMVEPIDEPAGDLPEPEVASAGQRLRAAREEKGLTLEDVAAQTRIPRRHLESLENSDWERLPAPTYTTGFAKSYASAVGLDRVEIAEQLRVEMGGVRPISQSSEVFEPADPGRSMPKWLVLGAIAIVLVLVLVMSWLNERSFQQADQPGDEQPATAAAPQPGQPAPAAPATVAQGPVVLTANEQVWIQVKDGQTTLKEGLLEPGQSFEVPAAAAPVLMTGKPEALRISVGTADAPPVGPAATTVRNVSLKAADLMRGPAATTPTAAPPAAQNTAG
ncbi:helix-turn-helix domain-containing protein [Sphingomonas sp.]|uniref:helix-turn-helix domain-containing protein n=1 Tax=Sphingomonas sp. TaxID=28214 RepID=UPI0017F59678|nr:helix-turn-helix domain-containing protein [Sphingomonas sp.]MBA3512258.1 helix-turn-helix domain-containing protein [Sphingomonas sp.]